MIPSEVRSAEDLRRIVEERDAKNVTIAMADTNGLLRGKYISRDKLYSVLEGGWGMPPVVLALDFDDVIMAAPVIADGSDGFADAIAGRCLRRAEKFPGSLRDATFWCSPNIPARWKRSARAGFAAGSRKWPAIWDSSPITRSNMSSPCSRKRR